MELNNSRVRIFLRELRFTFAKARAGLRLEYRNLLPRGGDDDGFNVSCVLCWMMDERWVGWRAIVRCDVMSDFIDFSAA